MFPDKLRVSSLPDRFPHYACTAAKSAHSNFVGTRVYACLGVTCHLHFWRNDRGRLRATAVTRGWNGHRKKLTKVDSGEENFPPLLPGFELATFRSRVRRSYHQAIPAPSTRLSNYRPTSTSQTLVEKLSSANKVTMNEVRGEKKKPAITFFNRSLTAPNDF